MSRQFDDEALRAAYAPALGESTTKHGPDCPTEIELLAAVRGEGDEAARLRVLDHALKCPACRRELALLDAVSRGEKSAATRRTVERSSPRWMPVALAASLMIAVGVAGVTRSRNRAAE